MPPTLLVKCKFNGVTHSRRMSQFPIDLCIAKTAHGVQGQTCSSVLIASWPKNRGGDSSTWVYVALSRPKECENLYLLSRCDPSLLNGRPNPDVVHVTRKFLEIEAATFARFGIVHDGEAGLVLPPVVTTASTPASTSATTPATPSTSTRGRGTRRGGGALRGGGTPRGGTTRGGRPRGGICTTRW